MKTQAWGWLAAGVVALGLNGFYQDGGFAEAHRCADRIALQSAAVLALASGRAEQFVAEVRILGARDETASSRLATTVAQAETRIAHGENELSHWQASSWQATSERREAQFARLEAAQQRMQAVRTRLACRRVEAVAVEPAVFELIKIQACPKVHVNIPAMPVVNVPQINTPHFNVPTVSIPPIRIPRVEVPKISMPAISVPAVPAIQIEMSDAGPV